MTILSTVIMSPQESVKLCCKNKRLTVVVAIDLVAPTQQTNTMFIFLSNICVFYKQILSSND